MSDLTPRDYLDFARDQLAYFERDGRLQIRSYVMASDNTDHYPTVKERAVIGTLAALVAIGETLLDDGS